MPDEYDLSVELRQAIAREAIAKERSECEQITHWLTIGRAVESMASFDFGRVESAFSQQLAITELTEAEHAVWSVLLIENLIRPSAEEEGFFAERRAKGLGVGLDDHGNIINAPGSRLTSSEETTAQYAPMASPTPPGAPHEASSVNESAAECRRAERRAQLREEILSQYETINEEAVWRIPGQPGGNAAEMLEEMARRGQLLRLIADGKAVYPNFQFDTGQRSVKPAVVALLRVKPANYSEYQILHWLTRPHVAFGKAPLHVIAGKPGAVLAAFLREFEPIAHG